MTQLSNHASPYQQLAFSMDVEHCIALHCCCHIDPLLSCHWSTPDAEQCLYVPHQWCNTANVLSSEFVSRVVAMCAGNILFDSCGVLKLCDFGLSLDLSTQRTAQDCSGTVAYMAPEVLRCAHSSSAGGSNSHIPSTHTCQAAAGYSLAADIWSLGCVAYEVMTGRPLLFKRSPDGRKPRTKDLAARILALEMSSDPGALLRWPETMSQEAKDFIVQCLRPAAPPLSGPGGPSAAWQPADVSAAVGSGAANYQGMACCQASFTINAGCSGKSPAAILCPGPLLRPSALQLLHHPLLSKCRACSTASSSTGQ